MLTKEQKAEYQRKWYQKNKEKHKANSIKNRHKTIVLAREFIKELKEKTPCVDCKGNFPSCAMDFDHLSDDKSYSIGWMVQQGYSIAAIQLEIDKCELVCANCHRIRTHIGRKQGSVAQR
jgi:hypothetical protein